MEVPLELTFRNMDSSPSLDSLVREEVEKLDQIADRLIGCHVAVEKPHSHQRSGNPYRVRIDMTIPDKGEIVVSRDHNFGDQHADLYAVVRSAFSTAQRRLKKEQAQLRGDVKVHQEQQAGGVVNKIFIDLGYGFILTPEGEEIYFHRNSVLHDDFERLEVGAGVQYVREVGEEGPQASTVRLVDKPGTSDPANEVHHPEPNI